MYACRLCNSVFALDNDSAEAEEGSVHMTNVEDSVFQFV